MKIHSFKWSFCWTINTIKNPKKLYNCYPWPSLIRTRWSINFLVVATPLFGMFKVFILLYIMLFFAALPSHTIVYKKYCFCCFFFFFFLLYCVLIILLKICLDLAYSVTLHLCFELYSNTYKFTTTKHTNI